MGYLIDWIKTGNGQWAIRNDAGEILAHSEMTLDIQVPQVLINVAHTETHDPHGYMYVPGPCIMRRSPLGHIVIERLYEWKDSDTLESDCHSEG